MIWNFDAEVYFSSLHIGMFRTKIDYLGDCMINDGQMWIIVRRAHIHHSMTVQQFNHFKNKYAYCFHWHWHWYQRPVIKIIINEYVNLLFPILEACESSIAALANCCHKYCDAVLCLFFVLLLVDKRLSVKTWPAWPMTSAEQ